MAADLPVSAPPRLQVWPWDRPPSRGPACPSSDKTVRCLCVCRRITSGSRAKRTASPNVVIKRGQCGDCPQVTEVRWPLGDRYPEWPL